VAVVHDLSPAEKEALGGEANLVLMGREVTEQLEWEPSCLYVIRHVQLTYARRNQLLESGPAPAEQNVVTAAKPPQMIPGALAGPGLLAQVLVSKYADHVPRHRLERITARQGMLLPRQTTCDWALACAERLGPLMDVLRQEVLASAVLHLDDTSVKIRDGRRKRQHTGYFWTQVGDEQHPLIVFHYTPHHRRDGPEELLAGFQGYLQADAAKLYDRLYREPDRRLVEVGCWMHARRKFFDARTSDRLRAETALAQVGRLYAIERELPAQRVSEGRELPWEEYALRVAAVRQERARPILEELRAWMDAEAERLLPKSPLRQAMEYARGNWTALCRYTEDGRLDIDNGEAERALRGIALGRRNWLFCGSDRGGRAAAVHFSLIASCHRHQVDPFAYLRDLLTRLPALGPHPERDELRALLPDRWKRR
jgi:transposase